MDRAARHVHERAGRARGGLAVTDELDHALQDEEGLVPVVAMGRRAGSRVPLLQGDSSCLLWLPVTVAPTITRLARSARRASADRHRSAVSRRRGGCGRTESPGRRTARPAPPTGTPPA